jgi:hypothetical protein
LATGTLALAVLLVALKIFLTSDAPETLGGMIPSLPLENIVRASPIPEKSLVFMTNAALRLNS